MMAYQRLLLDNRFLKSYKPSANFAPLSRIHSSSDFSCQSKVAALSFARRPSRLHCCFNHSFLDPTRDVTYKKPMKTEFETDLEFSSIGMKTDVDWLNLTHEEFEEHLNKLRQRVPNFSPAMLCEEECNKFWLRRNIAAQKLAKELSDMVGNNDLIMPLEDLRRTKGGDCLVELINEADQECSNDIPDEEFVQSEIDATANMHLH